MMGRGLGLIVLVLLFGCGERPPSVISGQAMGARYHITLGSHAAEADQIEAEVSALLESIESQASQWRTESWVSRFNRAPSRSPVPVPEHVWAMLVLAESVHRESGGLLDVTAGPLVELWGFGASPRAAVPTEAALAATRARCGADKLVLDHDARTAAKAVPGLAIDLSALGKGYAVDRIADLLDRRGVKDYLVAFGGEVCARGDKPGDRGWVVEVKTTGGAGKRLTLHDESVASSGGSEQVRQLDGGETVTHLIDPRSGRSVADPGRAVAVVSRRCVEADAWATALSIVSDSERPALAERAAVRLVDVK